MGRVSVIRTRSPTPHSFFSSWTLNRLRGLCLPTRRLRVDLPTGWGGDDPQLAFAQHRHDPGDVVAHLGNLARVLELADRVLEAELVELTPRRAHAVLQLVLL